MSRSPFQVLIIPYRIARNELIEYGVTKRADGDIWQFLSGGGEADETPIEAAKREANEEGGIPPDYRYITLDSTASIPRICFNDYREWGSDMYVIPEYSFGVDITKRDLVLSSEHTELLWLNYDRAYEKMTYDSNKIALWELNQRLSELKR